MIDLSTILIKAAFITCPIGFHRIRISVHNFATAMVPIVVRIASKVECVMPGLLVIVILLRLLLLGVIVQVGIVGALIILITIALVVLIIALSVVIIGCILVTTAIRAILILLLVLLWCRLWVVIDSLLLLCGRHRVILVNDRKSMKLAIATSLILEDGRCLMAFSVD